VRLAFFGSSDVNKTDLIRDVLDRMHIANRIELLIHGGLKGADAIAHRWALDNYVPVLTIPANWRQGFRAACIRNRVILSWKPDALLVFPGVGPGAKDMMRAARARSIPIKLGNR
jgi:hypothetical protein